MGLNPAEQYCMTQLVETELWYFAFDTSVYRISKRDYIPVFKNTMCIITHLGAYYAKVIVPSLGESFFVLRTFMRKL